MRTVSPPSRLTRVAAVLALLVAASPVFAADPPKDVAATPAKSLPAWEQLTPAQREQLIAPVRERWNNQPEERQRMLDRAERWQQMTPEQRNQARHGMKRWEHMSPEQREQMRALYAKMRGMDETRRAALKAEFRAMTPEQRRAWVQANPAPPEKDRPPQH
ncbi:DUF3106 domain-containing protein [Lysobacter sp. S4-A87]|uniref:DUF3106 domain-containing protein n=1 Tax=Lysobacter sp. S4-A87 TaxID=2925843 RepID=UPI001F53792F|nr:DUF3106 domain-containing protein [Lysobacter sp. S4-A87]UNK49106.1 DUF3106 domain-containing protein [Lysobacter sp. S4-A87]